MTNAIVCRNVNQALSTVLQLLNAEGIREQSRNGPVIVMPGPLMITYTRPWERVLFSPLRDANPFFHLLGDALWCMAGREDIKWPAQFNKRYADYSDDGIVQPAAYGARWRNYFGWDQLAGIVEELKKDPNSRRAVLGMWDVGKIIQWDGVDRIPRVTKRDSGDPHRIKRGTKDAPCNTHAYFDCRGGKLNMTVCNRSNDVWWGMLGANVVQFSVLQEWMAAAVGVRVGEYRQFANNVHIYPAVVPEGDLLALARDAEDNDHYVTLKPTPPLVQDDANNWLFQAEEFCKLPDTIVAATEPFFSHTVFPMFQTWMWHRDGRHPLRYDWCEKIAAPDWQLAVRGWLDRRTKN